MFKNKNILIVMAHLDDVEITLNEFVEKYQNCSKINILIMCSGLKKYDQKRKDIFIGNFPNNKINLIFKEYEDVKLYKENYSEIIDYILLKIDKLDINTLITHHKDDLNQDHIFLNKVCNIVKEKREINFFTTPNIISGNNNIGNIFIKYIDIFNLEKKLKKYKDNNYITQKQFNNIITAQQFYGSQASTIYANTLFLEKFNI